MNEKCTNPWKEECANTDIEVYIIQKEENKLPICHECWTSIAESNHEWGAMTDEEAQHIAAPYLKACIFCGSIENLKTLHSKNWRLNPKARRGQDIEALENVKVLACQSCIKKES